MTAGMGGLPQPRQDQLYRPPAGVPGQVGGAAGNRFRTIIIYGQAGGLFVYSPVVGPGNLVASVAGSAGTDPYGNSYPAGIASMAGNLVADLVSAGLSISSRAPLSRIITGAEIGITDTVAASGRPSLLLIAPVTSRDTAGMVQLFGGSPDGTEPASVVIGTGPPDGLLPVTTALAEIQGSLAVGPALGSIREFCSPSGGDDYPALNTALSSYGSADLGPGDYFLSAQLPVAGARLAGCDMASSIMPYGSYAGPLLSAGSKGSIRGVAVLNGGSDAIQVPAGALDWWLADLLVSGCAGWAVNIPSVTGTTHGKIRNMQGGSNGGGIRVVAATAGKSAQINISDIDLQSLATAEAILLVNVVDILVSQVNASVLGSAGVPTMHLQGGGCIASQLDIGVVGTPTAGVGVLHLENSAAGAVSGCQFSDSGFQEGGVGVVVDGGTARCMWTACSAQRNQGDGWQWNGTGTYLASFGCFGNDNNQAGGVAYDSDITSTAHVGQFGFGYQSGAVTAGRNITAAGNHVTDSQPSGLTSAGNAPAGW